MATTRSRIGKSDSTKPKSKSDPKKPKHKKAPKPESKATPQKSKPRSPPPPPPPLDLLVDGPATAATTILLAHGAGAPMDSPFMTTIARDLAARGLRVVRFEFLYMARRRATGKTSPPDREPALLARYREAVAATGDPRRLLIGGKSLGGRMASLIADELGVRGLVCLGYPFHPPGAPERTRTAHLAALRTPALIVQGERDPFGLPDEVRRYTLSTTIKLAWLPDGDHSLTPRASSGHTEADNLARAAALIADFARSLTPAP